MASNPGCKRGGEGGGGVKLDSYTWNKESIFNWYDSCFFLK